ncbi:glycosyltransferase [Candidatus Micrarchaeota archaeon]|nr:glycosyltransferase [Candidatus Micrarchaeota archaeon]
MESDLAIRWALVIAIMGVSIGGVNFGIYMLFFIVNTLPERILAFLFLLLVTVNTVFNVFGCYYYLRSYGLDKFTPKKITSYPKVAVVMPTRNEDEEMVMRNMQSITELNYPKSKLNIYLLDNSSKKSPKLKEFCKRIGVKYLYMENPMKLKSYVMNRFMNMISEEYVAIFDADEYLVDKDFLLETLPFFDKKTGFVQTVKEFAPGSFFSNAVNVYYLFFYRFMQPVRNLSRSSMFCGSCGVVRRSVVKLVGGFPSSPTEDLAFAFKADVAGRGGVFVSKTYAFGASIESFETFLSQQWRYTIGNMWALKDYFSNFAKLTVEKHVHYLSQTFGYAYLSVLYIFYAMLAIIFIITDISLRSLNSQVLIPEYMKLVAVSYIISVVLLVVLGGRLYFGSFKSGLLACFLNFATAVMRTKAMLVGLFGSKANFVMSRQENRTTSLLQVLRASSTETLFSAVLFSFSILSFIRKDVISAFWLFWYSWLFFCTFLFTYATRLNKVSEKPHTL